MVMDVLAKAYADYFVEHFSTIVSSGVVPDSPLISPIRYPHQNISGNVYRGTNQFFLQILSCKHNYLMPLWMTFNQMSEIGIHPNKGVRSAKIGHFDYYVLDKEANEKVAMSISDYLRLTPDERRDKNLCLMSHSKYFNVFNIAQTNFSEVYPDEYAELQKTFSLKDDMIQKNDTLDSLVTKQAWCCPIETDLKLNGKATYIENQDVIRINDKSSYRSDNGYYRDLLAVMARSTGSEMRLDRDIWSKLVVSTASEGLLEELCVNMMGSVIGMSILPHKESLANMKEWIELIQTDSTFIYNIMQEASKAADFMMAEMGINLTKGVDLSNILKTIKEDISERKVTQKSTQKKRHVKVSR